MKIPTSTINRSLKLKTLNRALWTNKTPFLSIMMCPATNVTRIKILKICLIIVTDTKFQLDRN